MPGTAPPPWNRSGATDQYHAYVPLTLLELSVSLWAIEIEYERWNLDWASSMSWRIDLSRSTNLSVSLILDYSVASDLLHRADPASSAGWCSENSLCASPLPVSESSLSATPLFCDACRVRLKARANLQFFQPLVNVINLLLL